MPSFKKIGLLSKRLAVVFKNLFLAGINIKAGGPERFRFFLEKTGGAFVKFGRVLSLRHDLISPAWANELFKLSNKSQEFPFVKMHEVFIREMGSTVGDFFSKFDDEPVAATSMSQVYQAWLKDGSKVAVKIQRPGTKEIFEADFLIIYFFSSILSLLKIFPATEVADDFIEWTMREMDFRHEANDSDFFYERNEGHAGIVIPKQYLEHTTANVLVREFIEDGVRLEDLFLNKVKKEDLLAKNIIPEEVAGRLVGDNLNRYIIDGLFYGGIRHADIIMLPESKIAFIKTGPPIETSKDNRGNLLKFIHGLSSKDYGAMAESLMEYGKSSFDEEIKLAIQADARKIKAAQKVFDAIKNIIASDLKKDIESVMGGWYEAMGDPKKPQQEKILSVYLSRLIKKGKDYGIRLPKEISLFFRTFAVADMIALQLWPDFDMIKALKLFFGEYPRERIEVIIGRQKGKEETGIRQNSVSDDWERFVEQSAKHRERALVAKERVMEFISYYAEKYKEVRDLVKKI